MIKHERIEENIYMVEYSNGVKIYINYGSNEYSNGNIKILPENYLIGGES